MESGDQGPSSQGGGGDDSAATPFQGLPEATSETWASLVGEGEGAGGGGAPRTVGVFLLDRFSESYGPTYKAAFKAAEQAVDRLGGAEAVGGFVWVDAPCQEKFARTLGVSDASVSCTAFRSFFFFVSSRLVSFFFSSRFVLWFLLRFCVHAAIDIFFGLECFVCFVVVIDSCVFFKRSR